MRKSCVTCGVEITGATQKRYCFTCGKRRKNTRSIRQLLPGEQVPDGPPRRYRSGHGYIRLRWKVGLRTYVETYEHRVFGDRVTTEDHVHHHDRNRANNGEQNLIPVTARQHYEIHRPTWVSEAARLYESGLSTPKIGKALGRDSAGVWRAIRRLNVKTRSEKRIAIPNRERKQ